MTDQGVQVKITEKADALPGERVRAVGLCFYKPVMELIPGNSYRLCRNPQNPRDASRIEVKDRTRVRATLNRDVARLLSQYLDAIIVEEPAWLVSLEIGRVSLIVSATRYDLWYKIQFLYYRFIFSFFLSLVLEDARWSRGDSGRPARSHKVAISIRVTSTKFQLIQDAFKLYDLTVVQK